MRNLSKEGRQEIINTVIDAINDGRLLGMGVSEIHNECFNTDYFIIGHHQAEEWLKAHYGVFAAIEKIKEYEKDNFGEVNTDLSSAEKVVNMLVYILGEEILQEISSITDNWDSRLDADLQSELLAELQEL